MLQQVEYSEANPAYQRKIFGSKPKFSTGISFLNEFSQKCGGTSIIKPSLGMISRHLSGKTKTDKLEAFSKLKVGSISGNQCRTKWGS